MKTTISNHREFKSFVNENRKDIVNINGIACKEIYPIVEVTNRHASYYDAEKQGNVAIIPPFIITTK